MPKILISDLYNTSLLTSRDPEDPDQIVRCRLCAVELEDRHGFRDPHQSGCPAVLFESSGLEFRADYATGGCPRGCCRWRRASATGSDLETVAQEIAKESLGDSLDLGDVYLAVDMSQTDASVEGKSLRSWLEDRIKTLNRAQRDAKALRQYHQDQEKRRRLLREELAALELRSADYVPEAYARQRQEILARYADVAAGEEPK